MKRGLKDGMGSEDIKVATFHIDGQITGVDKWKIFTAPYSCWIERVILTVGARAATPTTNYFDVQVNNKTAANELISADLSLTTLAADTATDLGVDQNQAIAKNAVLEFELTAEAATATLDDILVSVEYKPF